MTAIEDVVLAATRIGNASETVERLTIVCADTLRDDGGQLSAVVRGSKTGEDAVRLVQVAERQVRDSAAGLLTLQATIDQFIQDAKK
ncbi:MAG: hypothetical protein LBM23_00685 [Propionibacteriaceae bacterium]|jgi:hypothetical protein|nr:hypothetical protein [Propionibacteriaceae bacterium]